MKSEKILVLVKDVGALEFLPFSFDTVFFGLLNDSEFLDASSVFLIAPNRQIEISGGLKLWTKDS